MASQIDQNKSSREELVTLVRRAARKRSRGSSNTGGKNITHRSELKRSRIQTAVVMNERKRRRSTDDDETKDEDSKRKRLESLVVLGVNCVSMGVSNSSTACDVDKASRAIPPSS